VLQSVSTIQCYIVLPQSSVTECYHDPVLQSVTTIIQCYRVLCYRRYAKLYWTEHKLDSVLWRFCCHLLQLVNGKAEVILKLKDITPDPREQWEYRKLLVFADVNETVTGSIYSGNSTVYVRPEKYWLDFLPSSPSSFKPGFLYTGYVSYFGTVFI